jgi:hypothetical protein
MNNSINHSLVTDNGTAAKADGEQFFTAYFSPPHPAIDADYRAEEVSWGVGNGIEVITPYMKTESIQIVFKKSLPGGSYPFGDRGSDVYAYVTVRPKILLAKEGTFSFDRNTVENKITATFNLTFEYENKTYSVTKGDISVSTL